MNAKALKAKIKNFKDGHRTEIAEIGRSEKGSSGTEEYIYKLKLVRFSSANFFQK